MKVNLNFILPDNCTINIGTTITLRVVLRISTINIEDESFKEFETFKYRNRGYIAITTTLLTQDLTQKNILVVYKKSLHKLMRASRIVKIKRLKLDIVKLTII